MLGVLTGDIINSREANAEEWLPHLKELLIQYGEEPRKWEVFRGDSFQLMVKADRSLEAALHIKAGIKQIKNLDVRIGIGIGEENFRSVRLSESNGSAFVRSGECFEDLKKQNLAIKSETEMDEGINVMLSLALLSMNSWSSTVAGVIRTAIENPQKSQSEIAVLLDRSQSSVSEALTRGGFEEVMQMNEYFKRRVGGL